MHQQDLSKTIRLYYDDSEMKEFTARVISCVPCGEGWLLELDRTAFFAEGGGQDGDRGRLVLCGDAADCGVLSSENKACLPPEGRDDASCAKQLAVTDTTESCGIIYHHVSECVEPGTCVRGIIDWQLRFDRMQQHSAEHIVSGLVHQLYGFDNVGFRLTDEKTTLDFNGVLTAADVDKIELLSNEAVWKNVPFRTFFPEKEEEAALDYRSKIDIEGRVRLVEVPGYDLCACCAPHVKTSAEIGLIKIVDLMNYKGGVRLTIKCGGRALSDYGGALRMLGDLGEKLSSPRGELPARLEKLQDELAQARSETISWQYEFIGRCSAEDFGGISLAILPAVSSDAVRRYINERLRSADGILAVFFGSDEDGYNYIAGSSSADLRPLSAEINAAMSGRGGGKGSMVQGQVHSDKESIRRFFAGRSTK
ncbi:MAG: hypothetical protein IJS22_08685 [Lachnospiraceae bacterium]|nr:hypothetical protein [Lachnospiraceae bacterium]